jgi:hypothetical protein
MFTTRSKTPEKETLTFDQITQAEILRAILDTLAPHQKRALSFYYCEGETVGRSAALGGMGVTAFLELKRMVRKRFTYIIGRVPGLDVFRDGGPHA